MKTTRSVLGALLLGGPWALGGCGAGTYHIPNVEPVVKPKPEDDLLGELEAEGTPESKPTPAAAPAEEKPKAEEPKTEPASKPESTKAEPTKAESGKADAKKGDPAKAAEPKKVEPAKAPDAKKSEPSKGPK